MSRIGRVRVSIEEILESKSATGDDQAIVEEAGRPDVEMIEVAQSINDDMDSHVIEQIALEELTEAGNKLIEIRAVLESSLDGQGLDQAGARVANLAINNVTDRIGASVTTPSMESYTGPSANIINTQLTLEALGDTLKSIWEAIKATWNDGKAKLVAFMKRIFTETGRLKARAEKIKAAAATLGDTPTSATVKVEGIGKKLAIDGKIDPVWAGAIGSLLNGIGETVSSTSGAIKGELTKLASAIGRIDVASDNSINDSEAVKELVDAAKAHTAMATGLKMAGVAKPLPDLKGIAVSEGFELYTSGALPGDAVFYMVGPKSPDMSFTEVLSGVKIGFYDGGRNDKASDDVPVPKAADLTVLAEGVIKMMDDYAPLSKQIEEWSAERDLVIKAGDALIAKAERLGENAPDSLKSIAHAIPKAANVSGSANEKILSWSYNLAVSSLRAAAECVKAYAGTEAKGTQVATA